MGQTSSARPSQVTSPLRIHFLIVLVVSTIIGAWLYLDPGVISSFWPYAMKPLATRFFSSVFFAVAVATVFGLREKEWEEVVPLLIMGVSVFGLILLAALIGFQDIVFDSPGKFLWMVIFIGLPAGGLYFLYRGRGMHGTGGGSPLPIGLKYSLLIHTVVVIIFALPMLIAPQFAAENFWPWKVTIPIMRGIGGLFVGVAIGAAWCYLQPSWERVRVLMPAFTTFVVLVLLAVGLHWDVLMAESPSVYLTVGWLILYVYTGSYPLFYLLRHGW